MKKVMSEKWVLLLSVPVAMQVPHATSPDQHLQPGGHCRLELPRRTLSTRAAFAGEVDAADGFDGTGRSVRTHLDSLAEG